MRESVCASVAIERVHTLELFLTILEKEPLKNGEYDKPTDVHGAHCHHVPFQVVHVYQLT